MTSNIDDSRTTEKISMINMSDFDNIKSRGKITVKFFIDDATPFFTHSFNIGDTIKNIKTVLEKTFNIPSEFLCLYGDGVLLRDKDVLGNFQLNEFGILNLKAESKHPERPLTTELTYTNFVVPDIITVTVDHGEETRDVVVEIENRSVGQPRLGGYKCRKRNINLFNNITQTGPRPLKVPVSMRTNRDTQTYFTRHRETETTYSRATQMFRSDVYIPSITDRIIVPGPYETAEEREKRMDVEGKVRTIQRYYRAWKVRKELKVLHEEYQKRLQLEMEEIEREHRDDAARRRRDVVAKVFPITLSDFAMLYTMTERWKKTEIARISSMHCGPSKIAEFYLLLEKEIEILRNLEQLKNKVDKEMEVKKIVNFFEQICHPLEWYSSYKNIRIEMDTLETQRAREYFALYKKLCNKEMSNEDRIEVYAEVKEYLNDHPSNENEEIRRHIDRMSLMMARGMEKKYIGVLEKRIEALVIHHFKHVNEEINAHYLKLKTKKIGKDLFFCQRCENLKPISSFSLNVRTAKLKICTHCAWLDKAEEPWVDLLPYRYILKQIRNFERRHRAISSVAFILQDKDIHFIINNIWHGHSALSECSDIYELRLCRWNINQEWSPWNCILLTAQEAQSHLGVHDLEEVYEKEFFNHVFNKHALARRRFPHLADYDKYFAEVSKDDEKLDENSEFYNKVLPDCPFGEMQ